MRASGFSDLAVFGGPCPELLVEAANGDGTYTLRVNNVPQFAAEAQLSGSKFLVGDFNGDGLQDLAVLGADRSITFSLSRRDGTSTQATGSLDPTFAAWASQPGVQLVAADFRASGFSDLAVFGGPCPELLVEVANGDGTYTLRVNDVPQFAAEAQLPGSEFLIGDFNRDGLEDLSVLGADGSITLSLSRRDGTSMQVLPPIVVTSVTPCGSASNLLGYSPSDPAQSNTATYIEGGGGVVDEAVFQQPDCRSFCKR